ncbi:hypothetical protein QTP88_018419 [Uroleucon formosanum]
MFLKKFSMLIRIFFMFILFYEYVKVHCNIYEQKCYDNMDLTPVCIVNLHIGICITFIIHALAKLYTAIKDEERTNKFIKMLEMDPDCEDVDKKFIIAEQHKMIDRLKITNSYNKIMADAVVDIKEPVVEQHCGKGGQNQVIISLNVIFKLNNILYPKHFDQYFPENMV